MQEEKYLEGLKQRWCLVSTATGEETGVFVREGEERPDARPVCERTAKIAGQPVDQILLDEVIHTLTH